MQKILIIDDQEANVVLLERILRNAGYEEILTSTDSLQAIDLFLEFDPDLVLLDLAMPYLDGIGVMEQLRRLIPAAEYLPVLVLTADSTAEAKRRSFAAGANDYLTKPFDHLEVTLRVRNMLETRMLHGQLARQNRRLDERVRERTEQLERARIETLDRLACAAEYRDDETGEHTQRVGVMAARIAEALGMPARDVEHIRLAAPLHDLGKIAIPDAILLKPGRLTPEEWSVMKSHTVLGAEILGGSSAPVLLLAEEVARWHHERWDGTGYPAGLAGPAIPIAARVVAVADVFDALTHARPYKHAWALDQAVAEIRRQGGAQFDNTIVDAFAGLPPEVVPYPHQIERGRRSAANGHVAIPPGGGGV
ncbi:MAG TPA: HD domain-containing phosphohydrolase [Actinomycetota bacterium]|nr:HD domain-containing phosphohydrolase [Actinomycetota bacterium]